MKESRFYNKLLIWLMILLGAVNLLNKSALGLPPVDYAIYAAIAALTAVVALMGVVTLGFGAFSSSASTAQQTNEE